MFNNRKEAKEATKYEVLLCPYYAHAAVKEMGSNFILYTLFLIEDNKVKHITITPMDEHWGIGYSPLTRPTYEADMLTILEGFTAILAICLFAPTVVVKLNFFRK